jgi:hypothetical protein
LRNVSLCYSTHILISRHTTEGELFTDSANVRFKDFLFIFVQWEGHSGAMEKETREHCEFHDLFSDVLHCGQRFEMCVVRCRGGILLGVHHARYMPKQEG